MTPEKLRECLDEKRTYCKQTGIGWLTWNDAVKCLDSIIAERDELHKQVKEAYDKGYNAGLDRASGDW
jgi:uncharacterized coiled-coil DUF342 family protein